MAHLGYKAFDADNHYYEAEDAFTRHMDPRMAKRAMQWAVVGGKRRLLVGGKVNRFIPNPTFDPVAYPGALEAFYRGQLEDTSDIRAAFGELQAIPAEYRNRDARIDLMKRQGLQGAFFFPTLGVGMEEALKDDPPALLAAFRAFNRWLDDDWGFSYRDMIFAAPYITLVDPDWAVAELEWAIERDARVVVMRSGPVADPARYRSPGDTLYDPFWARASEAGITVAYHGGDPGYGKYAADWGEAPNLESFRAAPVKIMLSPEPMHDTLAALIGHGVFARHPNLRVATIENGSGWVHTLMKSMKKAFGTARHAFSEDPVETFRRHVWVSPFYEDGLEELAEMIGTQHMMMGSDFPHAEGIAEPTNWVKDISTFSAEDQRWIMRDAALGLSQRRP